jgi:hypothetical protein
MNFNRIITSFAAASASASPLATPTTSAADGALTKPGAIAAVPVTTTTLAVQPREARGGGGAPARPAPARPKITKSPKTGAGTKPPKAKRVFTLLPSERSAIDDALHTISRLASAAGKEPVDPTAHAQMVEGLETIEGAFDEARSHLKNPPLPRAVNGAEDRLKDAVTPDEGQRGTGVRIEKARKNLVSVAHRYHIPIGAGGRVTVSRAGLLAVAVGAGAWLV